MSDAEGGYHYWNAEALPTKAYIWPTIFSELEKLEIDDSRRRVFDLGCGNGATAKALVERGWNVSGVDPSEKGISIARRQCPGAALELGSSTEDLAARFGTFPAVISLEVVEHVFLPRKFAACIYDLLEPRGTALISTPYHGYWKNLALAVAGRMDAHFTALWDYGHIKFWSVRTLSALFAEAGMDVVRIHRVGRFPALAKSMVLVVRRP